jgi:YbbR domain-containing protein
MLKFFRRLFTENIGLKAVALMMALLAWFYIVKALNEGSEEEKQLIKKILPPESMAAKKLMILPTFAGSPKNGYVIAKDKVTVEPGYCIVVGTKDVLDKIRFVYTASIDVSGANKTISKSAPLNPIAPGVYMEETLVQVVVPIEKGGK